LQSREVVHAFLGTTECTGKTLDLGLSLGRFGGDTGGPIVELLLILANLAIYRSDAGGRGGARPSQIGSCRRIGDAQ